MSKPITSAKENVIPVSMVIFQFSEKTKHLMKTDARKNWIGIKKGGRYHY